KPAQRFALPRPVPPGNRTRIVLALSFLWTGMSEACLCSQNTVIVERWWKVPLPKEGQPARLHPRRHHYILYCIVRLIQLHCSQHFNQLKGDAIKCPPLPTDAGKAWAARWTVRDLHPSWWLGYNNN
uniref:Large ribosomal subunit protein bL9m N-terminal domain-containing protein n=1 Tax=Callorhinchus milii TaxID=7868 RepID=A0A4W3GJH5_CALMI